MMEKMQDKNIEGRRHFEINGLSGIEVENKRCRGDRVRAKEQKIKIYVANRRDQISIG